MATRTLAQNRMIRGLIAKYPEDVQTDVLRGHCNAVSGQGSSSKLTVSQAEQVIARLKSGVEKDAAPPDPRDQGKISPALQRTLAGLFALVGMDTEERRRGFSERQCGKPWPQTLQDADKILEGLEAMALRATPAQAAHERVQAAIRRNTPQVLDDWKSNWLRDVDARYTRNPKNAHSGGRLAKLVEIEAALEKAGR